MSRDDAEDATEMSDLGSLRDGGAAAPGIAVDARRAAALVGSLARATLQIGVDGWQGRILQFQGIDRRATVERAERRARQERMERPESIDRPESIELAATPETTESTEPTLAALVVAESTPVKLTTRAGEARTTPIESEHLYIGPDFARRLAGFNALRLQFHPPETFDQGATPSDLRALIEDAKGCYACPQTCHWTSVRGVQSDVFHDGTVGVRFVFHADGTPAAMYWLHRTAELLFAKSTPASLVLERAALAGEGWYIAGHPMTFLAPAAEPARPLPSLRARASLPRVARPMAGLGPDGTLG